MRTVWIFLCGVAATLFLLVGAVVVSAVIESRAGWERKVSVLRNEETGTSTVNVGGNPTRFMVKTEGDEPRLEAVWLGLDNEFLIKAWVTPQTTVLGVTIVRDETWEWNGDVCTDASGNRWRCVWLDQENQEIYEKSPDAKMARKVWVGSVTVEGGGIVFREDGRPKTRHPPSSVWVLDE